MNGDKPLRSESAAWRVGREIAQRIVPERALEKRRAARKAPLFREAGVAFVHVPRAAGTSIANALYGGHIGHFPLRDFLEQSPEDVLALPRFTVVRNPWERAVSSWRFARAGRGEGGQEALIRNPAQYRDPRFSSFEGFVDRFLDARDVDRLDPVFRTQDWYVRGGEGRGFDHVGRVENLSETADWLSEALGRRIDIGRHNRSGGEAWREAYTPRLVAKVGAIYARDVESFGYAF